MRTLAALLLLAAAPAPSRAQTASTGIVADRFAPGVGPSTLLGGEAAEVTAPGELAWSLSLTALRDPVRLDQGFAGGLFSRPVRTQLVGDAALEVGVFSRVALAVGMPVVLYADGDRLRGTGTDERPLGAPVGGDVRLRVKAVLVGQAQRRGLHLAGLFQVTVPAGGQEQFAATDGVTFEPRVLADVRFGRVLAAVELGARFQPERKLFLTTFGDELTWLAGAEVRLLERGRGGLAVLAEAAGAVGAAPGTRPAELRAALRLWLDRCQLDLGAGGGVTSDVASPAFRLFAVARGHFALD